MEPEGEPEGLKAPSDQIVSGEPEMTAPQDKIKTLARRLESNFNKKNLSGGIDDVKFEP